MDRNTFNTQEPSFVEISKGKTPEPPEPEYVQNVSQAEGTEVRGSKVNKIVAARLSEDENNNLGFGSDTGLFSPQIQENLQNGIGIDIQVVPQKKTKGLKERLKSISKVAINLIPPTATVIGGVKKSTKADNAVEIDAQGNLFVAKQSSGKILVNGSNTTVSNGDLPNTVKVEVNAATTTILGAIRQKTSSLYLKIIQGVADVVIPNANSSTLGLVQNSTDNDNATEIDDGTLKTTITKYQNYNVKEIIATNGIKGNIENNILTLTADSPVAKNDYYVKWQLNELAGFDGLDTQSSITWSDYAVAAPVVGLKVPKGEIGQLMGFDTEFFNKNPDGSGQREYRVKLKFSVITDAGRGGSSTVTIGKRDIWDQNEGAFHMWTAGIIPEIDYSNQHTERNDIYTFVVNNLRVTPITITLNKTVWIENRLRKFYFGISMKGWFPNPDTVNYKLYDYVELFLEEVINNDK
jgi:hypothetical protein